MSHHLDSPLARQDPRLNVTDQYVFDDGDNTVFVMNTRTSLAGENAPANFHDEARYEFKVHMGDAPTETLTFRFAFGPTGASGQDYQVFRLEDDAAADDTAEGTEVARCHTDRTEHAADGVQFWAGRALDPFFLDLSQLAAVDRLTIRGEDSEFTGFLPGKATNTFADSTVQSIVMRTSHRDTRLSLGRRIRVWSTTRLATDAGGWRQVSRAGLPMIWPLFRDADSDLASHADEAHPSNDLASYGAQICGQIAAAVRRLGSSAHPEAYADAVTRRVLPDALPYRIGTPAIFGFNDFNGRRLGDNAPEVMFSLATNSAVSTGLPAVTTMGTRSDTFPYVTPVEIS